MAVAVHSNVGLFHATMAVFNAWCDRMPIVILGATGPVDAAKRRPWIDWIHTARDQGAVVRNYTKWDDQPASPAAAREALLRAAWIANTAPNGPVYINLDAEMQEAKLPEPLPPIEAARFMPPVPSAAPAEQVRQAADLLRAAKHPVLLIGRVSRSLEGLEQPRRPGRAFERARDHRPQGRRRLPTDHPLHAGPPGAIVPVAEALDALRAADVIVSLDWVDLAGTLRAGCGPSPAAKVIQVSLDHRLHNGWSMDHQGLPPVDLFLSAHPDAVVPELLAGARAGEAAARPSLRRRSPSHACRTAR